MTLLESWDAVIRYSGASFGGGKKWTQSEAVKQAESALQDGNVMD